MTPRARLLLGASLAIALLAPTTMPTPATAAPATPVLAASGTKHFAGRVPDVPTGGVPDVPTGGVRDVPTGRRLPPRARIANLPYGGGPVMHSNRSHLIFWQPAGSGLAYDPGYTSQFEMFLGGVAADSRQTTNVYSLSGQYTDAIGPAVYDSTYGGAVLATDPLPRNGCAEPSPTGPGWSVCLQDSQLESEIEHVIAADRLPTTNRDVYFLVMPNGMGTCETSGPDNCALGGGADGSFCGYHSTTPDGSILYAVIPYNGVNGHCQSGNPRPNGSAADPSLSTLSHEHNETVTDPLGDAWIDGSGNENGDLCIAQYGPNIGGSGAGAWNEVIGGRHYYLQEEWSNADRGCRPRARTISVSWSVAPKIAAHSATTFSGRGRDPNGPVVAFDWSFGDGATGHGRLVHHAYPREGSYRVTLQLTDSGGLRATSTRTIRVTGRARDLKHRARDRKTRRSKKR